MAIKALKDWQVNWRSSELAVELKRNGVDLGAGDYHRCIGACSRGKGEFGAYARQRCSAAASGEGVPRPLILPRVPDLA
jgi:hypothetical protein